MKELSIKEKAKRYDDVLERAKAKYAKFEGMLPGNVLEDVFSELKESESEDERIKKELIKYIKSKYESPNAIKCDYEKWIAWLEKQGKKGTNGNEREISILKPPLTIKHAKKVMGIDQKSAWSREDEQNLNAALGYINDEHLCRWLKDVIHAKYDKPAWSGSKTY